MPQVVSNIVDVYVFRRRDDAVELLLLKRAASRVLGATWQAVHGKIEPPETAWQAALRELHEETGLEPIGFWQLDSLNTFYVASDDRVHLCPCFAAEVAADARVRLSDEHTEHRWVRAEHVADELMWPGQRRAVEELRGEIVVPGRAEPHLRIDFRMSPPPRETEEGE